MIGKALRVHRAVSLLCFVACLGFFLLLFTGRAWGRMGSGNYETEDYGCFLPGEGGGEGDGGGSPGGAGGDDSGSGRLEAEDPDDEDDDSPGSNGPPPPSPYAEAERKADAELTYADAEATSPTPIETAVGDGAEALTTITEPPTADPTTDRLGAGALSSDVLVNWAGDVVEAATDAEAALTDVTLSDGTVANPVGAAAALAEAETTLEEAAAIEALRCSEVGRAELTDGMDDASAAAICEDAVNAARETAEGACAVVASELSARAEHNFLRAKAIEAENTEATGVLWGDPVSPVTGGFHTAAVDIDGDIGLLRFTRSYASNCPSSGALCPGRRHGFEARIRIGRDDDASGIVAAVAAQHEAAVEALLSSRAAVAEGGGGKA